MYRVGLANTRISTDYAQKSPRSLRHIKRHSRRLRVLICLTPFFPIPYLIKGVGNCSGAHEDCFSCSVDLCTLLRVLVYLKREIEWEREREKEKDTRQDLGVGEMTSKWGREDKSAPTCLLSRIHSRAGLVARNLGRTDASSSKFGVPSPHHDIYFKAP